MLTSSFPRSPVDETCGYVREFARSLSGRYDVTVLAPPDGEAGEWPADSITVRRAACLLPRRFNPFLASRDLSEIIFQPFRVKAAATVALVGFTLEAVRLARKSDLICAHWLIPSGLVGAIISSILGKPLVVVEHSGALHTLRQLRGGRLIARFIISRARRIVAVSDDLKRKLESLCPTSPGRIEVLPMGIGKSNLATGDKVDLQVKRVLFVGRLTPIKGVDILLKAMEGLSSVRLIVAGDGEMRRELESLAKNLSLDAQFMGRVDAAERDALLSSCDALVIPSITLPGGRTEGTPVICLEAMAAGIPVIASNVGGLADMITDHHNGMLFDAGNHRMLARKLTLLLSDSPLRRRLSDNAKRAAASYAWAEVGPKFERLIQSSLV